MIQRFECAWWIHIGKYVVRIGKPWGTHIATRGSRSLARSAAIDEDPHDRTDLSGRVNRLDHWRRHDRHHGRWSDPRLLMHFCRSMCTMTEDEFKSINARIEREYMQWRVALPIYLIVSFGAIIWMLSKVPS